jgi:hypothetical protein
MGVPPNPAARKFMTQLQQPVFRAPHCRHTNLQSSCMLADGDCTELLIGSEASVLAVRIDRLNHVCNLITRMELLDVVGT